MDEFYGIIAIGIVVAVGLYLVFWFPKVVKGWIDAFKKRLPVRHYATTESQQVMNEMEPGALNVLLLYMNGFNRKMSTHRDIVTPAFLKEAYFPETDTFDPDVPFETMIEYFDNDYPNRPGIKSYFFDSMERLSDGSIAVGTSRLYHSGGTSRIRYIVTQNSVTGHWYMDHIARNFTGTLIDRFETSRGTQMYVLEFEEDSYLLYETANNVPGVQVGDFIYAEGYLVTDEELDGSPYYRLTQMHRLEQEIAV
ncbi:hypothetical protein [Paenibacillus tarimensis]|uniref:hypothetical protein n=1 Tax=Paenibacillus tarimensis TaxID=416012 RepID=UPI001F226B4D|nr:hypothetical protein [Paenibacillus tarimensis]MCF2944840.1 hypothetical protein [Paenibacillus tarimensis]